MVRFVSNCAFPCVIVGHIFARRPQVSTLDIYSALFSAEPGLRPLRTDLNLYVGLGATTYGPITQYSVPFYDKRNRLPDLVELQILSTPVFIEVRWHRISIDIDSFVTVVKKSTHLSWNRYRNRYLPACLTLAGSTAPLLRLREHRAHTFLNALQLQKLLPIGWIGTSRIFVLGRRNTHLKPPTNGTSRNASNEMYSQNNESLSTNVDRWKQCRMAGYRPLVALHSSATPARRIWEQHGNIYHVKGAPPLLAQLPCFKFLLSIRHEKNSN
jgi:hypothetical protein